MSREQEIWLYLNSVEGKYIYNTNDSRITMDDRLYHKHFRSDQVGFMQQHQLLSTRLLKHVQCAMVCAANGFTFTPPSSCISWIDWASSWAAVILVRCKSRIAREAAVNVAKSLGLSRPPFFHRALSVMKAPYETNWKSSGSDGHCETQHVQTPLMYAWVLAQLMLYWWHSSHWLTYELVGMQKYQINRRLHPKMTSYHELMLRTIDVHLLGSIGPVNDHLKFEKWRGVR